MISAADIHARVDWPAVLMQLGIPEKSLRNKHGPCPGCGGKDCFRFDHSKRGKGSFFCNRFGAGDGFKLLEHVYGWPFSETRKRVIEAAGLGAESANTSAPIRENIFDEAPRIAKPPCRVTRLQRETCRLENCDDAILYLDSRGLWPAARYSTLSAHASVEYFDNGRRVDRFPALVADVRDNDGDFVTAHVTYLANGQKLASHEPRKILSPMLGRQSCAVRLYPFTGGSMGIGEGLETCIAAAVLHELPVWAALNTSLLQKFTPPPTVDRLIVFADRDLPGMTAAAALLERLQGQMRVEIRTPPAPAKDWNDSLLAKTKGTA